MVAVSVTTATVPWQVIFRDGQVGDVRFVSVRDHALIDVLPRFRGALVAVRLVTWIVAQSGRCASFANVEIAPSTHEAIAFFIVGSRHP